MTIRVKKLPLLLYIASSLFLVSCADKGLSQGEYYSSTGIKTDGSSMTNKTVFDRITELEKRNDSLQKELRATTARFSSMWSKLEEIEQNMRGIAGDLDASTARQEENSLALQERIAKLEGEITLLRTGGSSDKIRSSSQIAESEQKGTADELYKAGLKLFQERKYSLAVAKLSAMTKQYPRASLVDNAYFWLGECYYQMQDYKNAILQYEKVIRDYPKSNKAPASYLKQGLSFIRVNNVQVGKIRLSDVVDKFPKSQEATRAKEELKKLANKK